MVSPIDFTEATVFAAALGAVTGFALHRKPQDATFWGITVAIFGLISGISKGFFFHEMDETLWARLFTWGVSCYTVTWGTWLRQRTRRHLEVTSPTLLLNPLIRKL